MKPSTWPAPEPTEHDDLRARVEMLEALLRRIMRCDEGEPAHCATCECTTMRCHGCAVCLRHDERHGRTCPFQAAREALGES